MNQLSLIGLAAQPSRPSRRGLLISAAAASGLLLFRRDALTHSAGPGPSSAAQLDLDRAVKQGDLCSPANAIGVGLRGEYFAQRNCQGPLLMTRIDRTVDFDASLDWPSEHRNQPPRSARWSGWVKAPLPGSYRFHCDVPGARLTVSRSLQLGDGAAADAHIDLAPGRFFPLTLELESLATLASPVRLEWTAPHGARYVIPRQLLFLPTETVAKPART